MYIQKNEKWLLFIFTMLACVSIAGNVFADFKVPPKPDNGWYIKDTSNTLTAPDRDILNKKIDDINKKSRNEIGVAIVPTLDGTSIADAAQDTFHQWGIGKVGLDNGILIFIAIKDRKIRIQTGNGAEGDLPDSVCNQIILGAVPFFKKNDYAGGISYSVDQINSKMESRMGQTPIVPQKKTANNDIGDWWVPLFFIGGLGLVGFVLWRVLKKNKSNLSYMEHSYDSKQPDASPTSYYVPDPHNVGKYATVGAAVATVMTIEERRKRQAKADAERAERDRNRRSTNSSSIGGCSDSSSSSSSSSSGYSSDSSSSSGGGGYDGGGFGGGDSGGGGADGGW